MHDHIAGRTLGMNRRAMLDMMQRLPNASKRTLTTAEALNQIIRPDVPLKIIRHFDMNLDFVITGDGQTEKTAIMCHRININEEQYLHFICDYAKHIGGGYFIVDGDLIEFDERGRALNISYEDDSVMPDIPQADVLTQVDNQGEG